MSAIYELNLEQFEFQLQSMDVVSLIVMGSQCFIID